MTMQGNALVVWRKVHQISWTSVLPEEAVPCGARGFGISQRAAPETRRIFLPKIVSCSLPPGWAAVSHSSQRWHHVDWCHGSLISSPGLGRGSWSRTEVAVLRLCPRLSHFTGSQTPESPTPLHATWWRLIHCPRPTSFGTSLCIKAKDNNGLGTRSVSAAFTAWGRSHLGTPCI